MKFRWDGERSLLWAGERSYPARFHSRSIDDDIPEGHPMKSAFRMETRAAIVHFENQWQLSTIWGDATYSSNNWFRPGQREFEEEPTMVEVGVLTPTPIVIPEQSFARPEQPPIVMPERETHLWGEPLGYVDVLTYHHVADLVMMLPTDIDLPEGEWDSAEGFCDLLITAGLEKTL